MKMNTPYATLRAAIPILRGILKGSTVNGPAVPDVSSE